MIEELQKLLPQTWCNNLRNVNVYVCRGLKIIREGGDYFLVHQGQIQRYLGSRRKRKGVKDCPSSSNSKPELRVEETLNVEEPCRGILDKILFFLGDLEAASADAKRGKVL